MHRTLSTAAALAALTLLGSAAFQSPPQDPAPPQLTPEEHKEYARLKDPKEPLRVSGIPSADKEKQAKQYEPLTQWLAKELGRPVVYVPVADTAEAITAFTTNKTDLAWFDALSAVRATELAKGRCQPGFARPADVRHTSYFVANAKNVGEGKLAAVTERKPMTPAQLAALKPVFAGLTFTFGEKKSLASHFMPRSLLESAEVAIDPEQGFKQKAGYAKDDAAVLAAVAAGTSDLGVVSAETWEKASAEQRAAAPVVFVTPEYGDACMLVHSRTGPVLSLRSIKAFFTLKSAVEEHKPILAAFGTDQFVPVSMRCLDQLAATLKSVKARKLID